MSDEPRVVAWAIWRQDDHGNRFLIEQVVSEEAARARVAALASLGHKQVYWCEPRTDRQTDSHR